MQLVELLLAKLPTEYRNAFRREGVLHEITIIGEQDLSTKVKVEPPSSSSNTPAPDDGSLPPPSIPPSMSAAAMASLRSRTQYLDPQDATILRARIIKFKYLSSPSSDETDGDADGDLGILRASSQQLAKTDLTLEAAKDALKVIAGIFGRPNSPMSSFEMLKSGVVEELLAFAIDGTRSSK